MLIRQIRKILPSKTNDLSNILAMKIKDIFKILFTNKKSTEIN
jgi:hypothetical protein